MPRGQQKVVIPREDLPAVSKLSDESYGYIMRYRIISEDQNRFSHWSPIRQLAIPEPSTVNGDLAIVGSTAILVWDGEESRSGYDIFLNSELTINNLELSSNVATVTVDGNHNLSVGTEVYISRTGTPVDNSFQISLSGPPTAIALQEDGKTILYGRIGVNGSPLIDMPRINVDGTLDTSFDASLGINLGQVRDIAVQQDGKIIAAGRSLGPSTNAGVVRLNADGSLDTSFNIYDINDQTVLSVAIQPDGKIIAAGEFFNLGTPGANHIVRLNSDGTVDETFNTTYAFDNYIYDLTLQEDGKILVAGAFNNVDTVQQPRLARLNSDGSLDLQFTPSIGNVVYSVAIQSDQKIIISGAFVLVSGGNLYSYIARINADGTLDTSFTTAIDGFVEKLSVQNNDKIYLLASANNPFTTVNGVSRSYLARLNSDGTLDEDFNPNSNAAVYDIAITPNDEAFIVGNFTSINGGLQPYFVKLNSTAATVFDGTHKVSKINTPTSFSYSLISEDIPSTGADGLVTGYAYQGTSPTNQYSLLINSQAVSIQLAVQIASVDAQKVEYLTIFETDKVDLV